MSADDIDDDGAGKLLGRHVKRLREIRRFTQEQLAERSGLASDTIRRLEHGDFSPSLKTLRKLAFGLDLPLSTIFEAMEIGELLDPEIVELTRLLRSHPGVPVRALTTFVEALVASGRGSDEGSG